MASVERAHMTTTLLIAALLSLDVAMMSGCDEQGKDKPAPTPQTTPAPAPAKPTTPAQPSTPPTTPSSNAPAAGTSGAPTTPTTTTPKPPATPKYTYTTTDVTIGKTTYTLDIAADPDRRLLGLGGREEIAEHGGMIFVFPRSQVGVQNFVMRDCPIDIDIIYTDGVGRVLAFHEMKKDPRREDEGVPGLLDPDDMTKEQLDAYQKYEGRLKKYSSTYPATFAIELKAGSIKKLGVREGDLVKLDHAGLKKMAK